MKNDFTTKKAWVTPSIDAAPIQITQAFSSSRFTEGTFPRLPKFGEEPAGDPEPGGAS